MGSDRIMQCTQLCLLVILALSTLTSWADGSPLEVMSAPNLLRVGTTENVFVEVQDCAAENDINVEITVMNFPTKSKTLNSTTVTLTKAKDFQAFAQIMIPPDDFSKDPKVKEYVYLQAKFPDKMLEKVVMLSFQSGYIFIQTDKTIYTPDSIVNYRLFGVSPGMTPVERSDASVAVEILTPDGVIVKTESKSLSSGIYPGSYQIGEIVSPGQWKIVAKFLSTPQYSYTAEFEVREYVLPSFEVKLSAASTPYFHVDSSEFTINIKATYLFGQEVDGSAFVVFGILEDSEKRSIPGSFQRVQIRRGVGTAKLKKEDIIKTFQSIQQLVGRSIYVTVSVLTESGSEMVEAELRGIQIVTSPYIIRFKKTPQYFKPGFSFNVVVEVLNPDNSPVPNVPVVVNPGAEKTKSSSNGIARLSVNTEQSLRLLTVTAKTDDPKLLPERQATTSMTAHPYTTKGNYYIHIDVNVGDTQVNVKLKPHGTTNAHDITYLILNGGQLVDFGRAKKQSQIFIAKIIPISKTVLPSFRIVAYYHTDDNEVVSDSLWVDVKDSCIGSLSLEPMGKRPYKPRDKTFGLKVRGDPGATVGLVAVDKGVYVLNNKHRLTQKKVWDAVEAYDTGCSPGGGKDSMGVFYDAGLVFQSGTGITTPFRQERKCPTSVRRKRASSVMDVRTSLMSQYGDKLQRECCLDGMRPTPLSYNCERRSEYIIDGANCVQAFLRCCKAIENLLAEKKAESLHLSRSEESEYMDSNEIVSRSKFQESWLWLDIQLPACDHGELNCVSEKTLTSSKAVLPDSITTWYFTGISLSRTHGICVADSLEVTVEKKFFIDLRLPYSAVRGEQLEVKAVLHNYNDDSVTVQLDLIENTDLCSAASKKGKYRQEVTIGAQTTKSIPYVIIPLKFGKFNIEVKAVVKGFFAGDGIIKSLLVVPEGELKKIPITITLDPAKKGGRQQEILRSAISLTDVVPNTPMNTHLSLIGREQMGPLVESVISGVSMGALIFQPMGCGEQNMAFMTLPVIATMYLDKTNQWESVGFDERGKALQHIETGRTNQLKYRKSDGSFAIWPKSQSSTWLTAYVVKVFAMASRLVPVEHSLICDAVKFLILNTQQPDGIFKEIGHVSQRDMIGDVEGRDSDASMTAFCLIALQEARTTCSSSVTSLTGSINKAVAYLENRLQGLTYSYAVAMTSYALANENKLNRRILNNFVSSDSSHWPVPGHHYLTLEATAYALLALVKSGAFEDARPVVRWFNEQRKVEGGYGSTQATIMVYQAVAEYWANAEEPEYNLNVDILLPRKSKATPYKLNRESQFTSRSAKFKDINQDVTVTATGKGEATLTMVSLYYAMPQEKKGNCDRFDMTLELQTEKVEEDTTTYKLIIKLLYKDNEHDAAMTVVDIGLLTGQTPDKDDLDSLSKGHARTIANYEKNTDLSEKGSLIIYLDKVSNKKEEEISFRLHQSVKVGILQPAAVSVYEFYNRSQCVKYYHPKRQQGELLRLCQNNECICAEENCSMQKKGSIPNENRATKACESTIDSKIEYVYKVKLVEFKNSLTTDIYTMQILDPIKQGSFDVGPQGNRTYLGYPHCRVGLGLETGKTYLIMGTSKDIYKDEKKQLYQYVLGENTWIEYWPTSKECQMSNHRATCVGLEFMVNQITVFGCQQK
ncbi:complement C3-like isoform X2 [Betta splendens]|uniref:Complement C3-like isoform X1 n=1 Tax=Betta splendens TaxID=158456 RepID=A0A6P7MBG7_BETSP|nr:complement C3-like isoform X1 [Betta splendens]XP_055364358.1 complement C3-like isoform X2 [Betta splendens]